MNKHSNALWWVGFIGTVLILGAFAISSLVLANVGIQVYHNVVKSNNEDFELRTSLNYVATRVRQIDNGTARMIKKDGIDALKLEYEGSTGYVYEVYIYYYDGYLREHTCLTGDPFELDYGFEMIEISDFRIELDTGKTLKMTAKNKAGETESMVLTLRTGS